MAWQFRLAPLLRYRARTEDLRALELARATEQRDGSARRLVNLSIRLAATRTSLVEAGRRGTTGLDLQVAATAVEVAARRARAAAERLAADEAGVETARQSLVAAARDRRVLERLEDVQREAYHADLETQLHRQLDDIASIYHVWRGRRQALTAGRAS